MTDAKKIDPFDVEALEKSLNDSATRVSTIWVSFLIFSLYLLVATATVEQRQLLLAEAVKLPVLNIDLPIWGFFFLAPILFVIFHVYTLLQVLLLGRTAAAYNEAIDHAVRPPPSNAAMRQRLANTLFAQIFAGSPREREGWLGVLLRSMAGITLAIAPILILLAFQFAFLPYHSHLATWTHRVLILIELAIAFFFWPVVLNAPRDFRSAARRSILPSVSCALFAFFSLSLATFPGEPHVNLGTDQPFSSVQCERWLQRNFEYVDLRFDRILLPGIDVVDDDRLAKIAQHTSDRKLEASEGERTRNFRGRNFNCIDLSSADLRRVDLTGAHLSGASLNGAALEGASLEDAKLQQASLTSAKLQDASLDGAKLQEASFDHANLQDATLMFAELQGASFIRAQLQGASLIGAKLQGASLREAFLQGAVLDAASLEAASIEEAQLQGASLNRTALQGASLALAQLQGASLTEAQLQGSSLYGAQLQGTDLNKSTMTFADLSGASVWRAKGAACRDAYVIDHKSEPIIEFSNNSNRDNKPVRATPEKIKAFIERSVTELRERDGYRMVSFDGGYFSYRLSKSWIAEQMRNRLAAPSAMDDTPDIATVWSDCEEAAKTKPQKELVQFLRDVVCNAQDHRKAIGNGIIRNWIPGYANRPVFSALLALGLLGEDGKECAAAKDFDDKTKELLRTAIAAGIDVPASVQASPPDP